MAKRVSFKLYGPETEFCRMVASHYGVSLDELAKQSMIAAVEKLLEQMELQQAQLAQKQKEIADGNTTSTDVAGTSSLPSDEEIPARDVLAQSQDLPDTSN